jgi:hypothetical protein
MHLDLESPTNRGVLDYLRVNKREVLGIEQVTSVTESTWSHGSHPDIVEHLWEHLAPHLPVDCRAVVCGNPALVAPSRGVIFAVAMGTEYALRLRPTEFALARAAGAEVVHTYDTVGVTLSLPDRLGPHWVFGRFDEREPEWCKAALEFAESPD